MKTKILGIDISAETFDENLERVWGFLKGGGFHAVFTPNPEVLMHSRKDKEYFRVLNSGDLVTADGIGVLIASLFNKVRIKQRTTGVDLICALFAKASESGAGLSVYLLGAKPGVAKDAAFAVESKYPGVAVSGFCDGYFDEKREEMILKELQELKPDLLLVGLGYPKQEKWIYENRERLPVKAAVACGGSIDVLSGKVKRAPKIFRRIGAEWLYRLITQPRRLFRMLKLPLFLIYVIRDTVLKNCKS